MDRRVPCVVMRGGTSKAIVFAAADLPVDSSAADRVILDAFGSPDPRQIDGLGGADPLTSKLAIVSPSEHSDADVDYLFGQVGIATGAINYRVSCGNTAAAVAVFAIQEGLVPPGDGQTSVRIFSRNSKKIIVAEVPTRRGEVVTEGDFSISGVPRPGPEIRLQFLDPAGSVTGQLLPSGSVVDEIDLQSGDRIRFSLVDCGNLYALMRARDFGLDGTESPEQIESMPGFMQKVEDLRAAIAAQYLPPLEVEAAPGASAARLKIAVAGQAGGAVSNGAPHLHARIINPERVHKAFAVTGAINVAAAAGIPGTIVSELCAATDGSPSHVRIGHPQGCIDAYVDTEDSRGGLAIRSVRISRTARRILDGHVYVPVAG